MIPTGWAALLLAVTLIAGVAIGWAVCMWMTPDHCEDCPQEAAEYDEPEARPTQVFERVDSARRTVVLEPGPTIYPQLADLADVPRPAPPLDGPGHHTGPLWLQAALMGIETRYPIPGTPQWDARHLEAVA